MDIFSDKAIQSIRTLFISLVLITIVYWIYTLGMTLHKKALGINDLDLRIQILEQKIKIIEDRNEKN